MSEDKSRDVKFKKLDLLLVLYNSINTALLELLFAVCVFFFFFQKAGDQNICFSVTSSLFCYAAFSHEGMQASMV